MEKNKFNILAITLCFTNVIDFECKGGRVGFNCTPVIDFKSGNTNLIIENENLYFRCVAEFMFIDDVTPHYDSRFSE